MGLFYENDDGGGDDGDDVPTTHPSWQVPESNTHRDQISRSGIPHSDHVTLLYSYMTSSCYYNITLLYHTINRFLNCFIIFLCDYIILLRFYYYFILLL